MSHGPSLAVRTMGRAPRTRVFKKPFSVGHYQVNIVLLIFVRFPVAVGIVNVISVVFFYF